MKAAGERFFFRLDVEQVQWMSKPPKAITKLRPLGYDVILSGPLPNLRMFMKPTSKTHSKSNYAFFFLQI